MIDQMLSVVAQQFPKTSHGDGSKGGPFFHRYDVGRTDDGAVYLHEFLRSDSDRCLHDHPWGFTTVILCGGYWEEMARTGDYIDGTIRVWRPPGFIGTYPAEHRHRIELDPDKPKPWSIVFRGSKSRPWGFWTPTGFVPWKAGDANPICEA